MTRLKVAGVTVLYHPGENLASNISSYLGGLEHLYVIDNSEGSQARLPEELLSNPKIEYIQLGENIGISQALNFAAAKALSDSFDFLLTMDQDSSFRFGDIEKFIEELNTIDVGAVAIFAPQHLHPKSPANHEPNKDLQEAKLVMTSGNLLNLKIFEVVGPFATELFIDHVDHEYCLRVRSQGYRIAVSRNIILTHALGEIRTIKLLGATIRFVSHSPLRTYYMVRNGLFVANKYRHLYRDFYFQNFSLIGKEVLKILFEPSKLERLKSVWRGISDYKNFRMGKQHGKAQTSD